MALDMNIPVVIVGASTVGDDCVLGPKSACLDGVVLGDGVALAPLASARGIVPAGALVAGPSVRVIERG